jgi:DNA-binding XRE family transcriptional regulator
LHHVAQRDSVRDMNGTDLKVMRIRAHVRTHDLAKVMGVKDWTISRLERDVYVPPEKVDRYVAGLATLATTPTPKEAA